MAQYSPFGFQDHYPYAAASGTQRDTADGIPFVRATGYFVWQRLENNGPKCNITDVNFTLMDRGAGNKSYVKMFIHDSSGARVASSNQKTINYTGSGPIDVVGYPATSYTFTFGSWEWDNNETIYLSMCSPADDSYGEGELGAIPALAADTWSYASYPTMPGYARYPFHWLYFYGNPECTDPYGTATAPITYYPGWYWWSRGCAWAQDVPISWMTNPPNMFNIPAGCKVSAGATKKLHLWFDAETQIADQVEPLGVDLNIDELDIFRVGSWGASDGIDIEEVYQFADVKVHPYHIAGGDPAEDWLYPWHPNIIQPWGQWL